MIKKFAAIREIRVNAPFEKSGFGKAVSRILSSPLRAERIICLCSQYPEPVRFRETRSGQLQGPLFGLAPDGVCRASSLALRAVVSYSTFSPLPEFLRTRAVYSLWHFPSGRLTASPPACISDRIGVTRHRALRSSDFPPLTCARSDSPPFQNRGKYIQYEEIKQAV